MGGAPPEVVRVVGGASLMSACVCLVGGASLMNAISGRGSAEGCVCLVGGAPPVSLQSLSLKFVC